MKIKIQKEVLSDRSEVFNIVLLGYEQTFIIPATSAKDAQKLRDSLIELITNHSCEIIKPAFDSDA